MNKFLLILLVLCAFITLGAGLECYACIEQDNNKDKCIKTTKQCEQHQEVCSTTINWAIPPYWTPHGERIYFISKDCDTRRGCENRKLESQTKCKRDWYDNWTCVDCCSGDLCNYYVTLGAGSLRASILLPSVLSALSVFIWRLL